MTEVQMIQMLHEWSEKITQARDADLAVLSGYIMWLFALVGGWVIVSILWVVKGNFGMTGRMSGNEATVGAIRENCARHESEMQSLWHELSKINGKVEQMGLTLREVHTIVQGLEKSNGLAKFRKDE